MEKNKISIERGKKEGKSSDYIRVTHKKKISENTEEITQTNYSLNYLQKMFPDWEFIKKEVENDKLQRENEEQIVN